MNELIDVLKTDKVVFGADRTIKLLKNNKLSKIFIANNCADDIKNEIEHYAKIANVEVNELDMKNNEVGIFCKKTFFISVVSVEK